MTMDKCLNCKEEIDRNEIECEYCDTCCDELQMTWGRVNE